jgi:DNA-binding response OmpR family regulator
VLVLVAERRDRVRAEQALRPLGVRMRRGGDPTVIVLGGGERIEDVRLAHPSALILGLLGPNDDAAPVLDGGADGVLRGLERPAELRARVRALLRRAEGSVAGDSVRSVGPLQIDFRARRVAVSGVSVALSPSEYSLLACLASDPGRVFTKAELCRRCWGEGLCGPGRRLETHIVRLRRRLGAHAPMLVTVWSVGYRLADSR